MFAERIRRTRALEKLPILVLSSSAQAGETDRWAAIGYSVYLTKPAQPAELFDALAGALTCGAPRPKAVETPVVSQPSRLGVKVLLAEDNAVNRKLAKTLLEKRGYTVVVAENGQEALDALEREHVDLVLMDVQMPQLDGLSATRAIRAKEQGTGKHLPIIALTAHAMKGDRERCLEAGADDYLPKPIWTPDLFAAIEESRRSAGPRERLECWCSDFYGAGRQRPCCDGPDFRRSCLRHPCFRHSCFWHSCFCHSSFCRCCFRRCGFCLADFCRINLGAHWSDREQCAWTLRRRWNAWKEIASSCRN